MNDITLKDGSIARGSDASVLLISMPWTTLAEPSLGLSLLKGVLNKRGIPCRLLHLNLFLLEHLKPYTYDSLSRVFALNDFVFSGILDPVVTNKQLRVLRPKIAELLHEGAIDVKQYGGTDGVLQQVLNLRETIIPKWVEKWASEIAISDVTLVGFTCMFDQTIASVALAKRIRELAPRKMLTLGGYAVRSPTAQMLVKAFPWIDAVCDGEGEVTCVELARASAGEIPLFSVPGIILKPAGTAFPIETPGPPNVDLDENPAPDFDDFFSDCRRLSTEYAVDVTPIDLPLENSRGCWWGAKHHCTFCGIKDEDMAYRARSAERVIEDMAQLSRKHGLKFFHFTDYILAHKYYDTLLPQLVQLGTPYSISAEMKANITPEKFELLARAGFEEVQPGIESFSSDALRKMDKGVTSVQNVQLLMLGRRFGVRVYYNILFGFPNDDIDACERMARRLPRLFHLSPPVTCLPVQVTRYAPLQIDPERFAIPHAVPDPGYDLIFSDQYLRSSGFAIEDYCYYFDPPYQNSPRHQSIYDKIRKSVDEWRLLIGSNDSWLYEDGFDESGLLIVRDKRSAIERTHALSIIEAETLKACFRPTTISLVEKALSSDRDAESIRCSIRRLDEMELVFIDEDRIISLVLPNRQTKNAFALAGLNDRD